VEEIFKNTKFQIPNSKISKEVHFLKRWLALNSLNPGIWSLGFLELGIWSLRFGAWDLEPGNWSSYLESGNAMICLIPLVINIFILSLP